MAWRKVGNLKGPQGESGAGYQLPAASATQLGGVKVGEGLAAAADGTASLRRADTNQLGGIIAPRYSNAVRIDTGSPASGGITVLTKGDGYGLVPVATAAQPGVVRPDGTTVTVGADGTLSAASGGGETMGDDEFVAYVIEGVS